MPLQHSWRETHAFPVRQQGQVIHREAFLPQQLGFEVSLLASSECIEFNRLRCGLRRGQRQQDAVTDTTSHLTKRSPAAHIDSRPLSLASKAGQVGLTAWCVSALVYSCLCKLHEL